MNFELSKEQQMIVGSVAGFVKDESNVERFRDMREDERGWDPEVWRTMGEYGWLGIAFPEQYGGIDGSFLDMALILEQFGRGLVPEPYIASVVLAGSLVLELGSDDQKNGLLAPMLAGEASLALAYAERQSRYRLEDCLTTASVEGDGYRISGEKVWVLNGHAADSILVVARTSGEQLDRDGLTLFVVPSDAEGLERTAVRGMDGQRSAMLSLNGVAAGPEQVLGPVGGALPALEWALDRAAAAACAEAQGALKELLDRTVDYLKNREQFGVKIGSFQALQHRAAEMFAEVELCKGTMILAALSADLEDPAERAAEISAAKVQLTDGGWFVLEHALQLHGGIALTDEQEIGLLFKRVPVLQGLFGDADHHVDRFQALPGFAA